MTNDAADPTVETDRPDIIDAPTESAPLARREARSLSIPELALRDPDPVARMDKVGLMIERARRISIRLFFPTDVVLFRREDGPITGYVMDDGVRRFLGVWGIEIYNLSPMTKIQNSDDPEDYSFSITGDGFCSLTGGRIEQLNAVRTSQEDIFKNDPPGAKRESHVQHATRSSLDAAIGRQLSGLESIPIEELIDVWKGTGRSIDACAKGKGFGTRDARVGAVESPDVDLVRPTCPVPKCGKTMDLKRSSRGMFYSCPDWKAHGKDAKTIDLDRWKTDPRSRKADPEPDAPPAAGRVDRMLDADEIFK